MTNETGQPDAVREAMQRALHQHGASDDPGHVTPDGRPRCFECDDPFPCDSHVLAVEVERLTRELATAELMRDAWMGEYQRLQASRFVRISTSSSSTTPPASTPDDPDTATRSEGSE